MIEKCLRNGTAPVALVLAMVASAGCGSGGPYEYVKVSGKITYADGSPIPIEGMRLLFIAEDAPEVAGAHPRQAMAHVNERGEFECATTYKYGDGLIPGRHKVVIQAESMKDGKRILPKSCLAPGSTELTADTSAVPMLITVPKP